MPGVTVLYVILGFKCGETAKILEGEVSMRFPKNIQHVMQRKLRMLSAA